MVRSSLLLVPVVALVGAWLGRSTTPAIAAVVALLTGVVVAAVIAGIAHVRLRALAHGVNAWMGKTEVEPVHLVGGGPAARTLSTALNALGAAYARRGERLALARPQTRELVLALPDPAMLFDDEPALVAANESARELFQPAMEAGASVSQALGSSVLADLVRSVAADGGRHRADATVGHRQVEAVATAFGDGVLLLARDQTASTRVEAVRRDFVANASHELKTPVAGIQSVADALGHVIERDPARARELAGRIQSESQRLANLVDDLLSLRRVDVAPAVEDVEVVAVQPLAAEVLADLVPAADARGVAVSLDGDEDVRARVVEQDLRTTLRNLVENAIRYNVEGGEVSIRLDRVGDAVVIEVADTGIGIPGKDHARIFERFYRVDPGRSREAGGTGLGLSIVRHAVERNGGTVVVESLLGSGSTFTVRLPAAPAG